MKGSTSWKILLNVISYPCYKYFYDETVQAQVVNEITKLKIHTND